MGNSESGESRNRNNSENSTFHSKYNSVEEESSPVLLGGSHKNIQSWDLNSGECITIELPHSKGYINCLKILTCRKIAVGGEQRIYIFDLKTLRLEKTIKAHASSIWCICELDSPWKIGSCSNDTTIRIFDIESGKLERTYLDHTQGVYSLSSFAEGTRIVSVGADKTLRIFDTRYGGCSKTMRLESVGFCSWVVYDSIESYQNEGELKVIIGCEDATVLLLNPMNEEILSKWSFEDSVLYISRFDESKFICCGYSGKVYMIDIESKERKDFVHEAGKRAYGCTRIDSNRFVSTGSNSVKIFNVKEGNCEKTFRSNHEIVCVLYLSGNSKLSSDHYYHPKLENRINFLEENCSNCFGLVVKFSRTSFKLPKSLIALQSELSIPDDSNLHVIEIEEWNPDKLLATTVLKILFGFDTLKLEIQQIFELFVFFDKMKMKVFCYVICLRLRTIADLEKLFVAFLSSVKFYENGKVLESKIREEVDTSSQINSIFQDIKEDKIEFKSVFTLTLFNIFKKRFDEINKNHLYSSFFERMNYFDKLRRHEPKIIEEHPNFDFRPTLPITKSFSEIFQSSMKVLFEDKKYSNLKLQTIGGEEILVHKEVLIFQSNFFYQMFKFPGLESRQQLSVDIHMGINELDELIRYIHLAEIIQSDLFVLLTLLIHSEMYFENYMKVKVRKKIEESMRECFSEKNIQIKLLEIGYLLFCLPEEMKNNIVKDWSKSYWVEEKLIVKLITYSKKINDLVKEKDNKIEELEVTISNNSVEKRKRTENSDDMKISPPMKKRKT